MKLLRFLIPPFLAHYWNGLAKPYFFQRYQRWLNKRIPPESKITLKQKNIFIFLSPAGYGFVALLFLLLVIAINYQNSLVYGFVFLLGSMMASLTWLTYMNLAGMTIQWRSAQNCFAGQKAEFCFQFFSRNKRYSIFAGWPGEDFHKDHIQADSHVNYTLFHQTQNRGVFRPGRLKIYSDYPSGLFRTWTWLDLDAQAIIYPKPVFGVERIGAGNEEHGEELHQRVLSQSDELAGFRSYQPGDNLKRIYWKSLAKGQSLLSKEFEEITQSEEWLDFDNTPGNNTEEKLSIITGWTIENEQQSRRYGLKLPGVVIQPDHGAQHHEKVLLALALFQQGSVKPGEGG